MRHFWKNVLLSSKEGDHYIPVVASKTSKVYFSLIMSTQFKIALTLILCLSILGSASANTGVSAEASSKKADAISPVVHLVTHVEALKVEKSQQARLHVVSVAPLISDCSAGKSHPSAGWQTKSNILLQFESALICTQTFSTCL